MKRENLKDIGDGWFEVTVSKTAMRQQVAAGRPAGEPLRLPGVNRNVVIHKDHASAQARFKAMGLK